MLKQTVVFMLLACCIFADHPHEDEWKSCSSALAEKCNCKTGCARVRLCGAKVSDELFKKVVNAIYKSINPGHMTDGRQKRSQHSANATNFGNNSTMYNTTTTMTKGPMPPSPPAAANEPFLIGSKTICLPEGINCGAITVEINKALNNLDIESLTASIEDILMEVLNALHTGDGPSPLAQAAEVSLTILRTTLGDMQQQIAKIIAEADLTLHIECNGSAACYGRSLALNKDATTNYMAYLGLLAAMASI